MERRHGPSISLKMILATTALIVLIVAGFGFLNIWNIGKVYDANAAELEKSYRDSLNSVGRATIQTAMMSARKYLADSDAANLRVFVQSLATTDEKISLFYVLDKDQGLVAHSDLAKNPESGNPPVQEPSWAEVRKDWGARKSDPNRQNPLVPGIEFTGQEGRLALFATPIFVQGAPATVALALDAQAAGDTLQGYVVIGYTFRFLEETLAKKRREKQEAFRDTGIKTGGVGVIFVLLGTILAIFQGLRISRPIKMLAWRADQIARGDLETRVEVTSTDEIGLLGENFNYMADQLVVLLEQTAERATMEKELEVARTIQETLVPGEDAIDRDFIKLAGYFLPASQCGGDWWTYHDLVDGKILVVIGDVTGHGVPAAMITAAAKASCDVARSIKKDNVSCTELLEIMNRAIYEAAQRRFVMTCFASIVDPRSRTITFANAGHNFPYIYRHQNGQGEFGSLMIRGNRLGDAPDSTYAAKTVQLQPGDLIVWYTDGIVECESERGEEWGEKRFRASVRRAADGDPAQIRDQVAASSMQFYGEQPRKDDITMVIGRIS